MKKINNYINEKLILNKDTKLTNQSIKYKIFKNDELKITQNICHIIVDYFKEYYDHYEKYFTDVDEFGDWLTDFTDTPNDSVDSLFDDLLRKKYITKEEYDDLNNYQWDLFYEFCEHLAEQMLNREKIDFNELFDQAYEILTYNVEPF